MRKALGRIREALRLMTRSYPRLMRTVNYDSYWDEKRSHEWYLTDFQKARLDIINAYIGKKDSILDIGVGDPSVLQYVLDKTGASGATVLDVSPQIIRECKRRGMNAFLRDIEEKDFMKGIAKSDVILVLEVLEHVKNSEEILETLLKNARKSVIFSVPNTGYIAHRFRLLFGSFPLQWVQNPSEHLRFWTLRDMRWWLRELKLEKKSTIIAYEGLPVLNKLFPGLFSQGLIVVVRTGKK